MIKVLKENPVPKATINCHNCDSLLEYGNADLHEDYSRSDGMTYAFQGHFRPYYFNCPVCGCKVNANWIIKKGEEV